MQQNADYQRLIKIKEFLDFPNDKQFAEAIGVSPQTFYDIKAGKQRISQSLSVKIKEAFPELNQGYILTGEGEITATNSQVIQGNNIHHNSNGVDERYVKHLEEEIARLTKRNEEQWQLIQKLLAQ